MIAIRNQFFALSLTAAALLPAAHAADTPPAAPDRVQKLEQRLDEMQEELAALKQQVRELKSENETLASAQQQQAVQQQSAAPAPASAGISENLSLWGYGEIYYTHPTHVPADTQFDLARAVFGIGYRFDDRTVFNSEYEVEHAVASADDKGEFEVEQFYVDHQLTPWASIKAGLFLMPFGLLNEHHEPTNFYGVQRNFVETLIIPSTWREGGVGLHGNTQIGLTLGCGRDHGPRSRRLGNQSGGSAVSHGSRARGQRRRAHAGHASGAGARQRASPVPVRVAELQRRPRTAGRRRDIHR